MRLARLARKTLTPRFTDLFTDFEKKPTVLQSTNFHATPLSKKLQRSPSDPAIYEGYVFGLAL